MLDVISGGEDSSVEYVVTKDEYQRDVTLKGDVSTGFTRTSINQGLQLFFMISYVRVKRLNTEVTPKISGEGFEFFDVEPDVKRVVNELQLAVVKHLALHTGEQETRQVTFGTLLIRGINLKS